MKRRHRSVERQARHSLKRKSESVWFGRGRRSRKARGHWRRDTKHEDSRRLDAGQWIPLGFARGGGHDGEPGNGIPFYECFAIVVEQRAQPIALRAGPCVPSTSTDHVISACLRVIPAFVLPAPFFLHCCLSFTFPLGSVFSVHLGTCRFPSPHVPRYGPPIPGPDDFSRQGIFHESGTPWWRVLISQLALGA